MILFAGLGNPGAAYASNRHNIGWMLANSLIAALKASEISSKFNSLLYKSGDILLAKPLTYMNASGEAISQIAQFYKPSRIIVAHDEMELAFARLKIQRAGSHAGHNGLKSVGKFCGSDYERIRLGIGRPPEGEIDFAALNHSARACISRDDSPRAKKVLAWVLGDFDASESKTLEQEFLPYATQAALYLFENNLTLAQNKFNR